MGVKIIAEAGSNHNGNIDLAYMLVDEACKARADYVKFQIINPDSLYVPYYWDGINKVENIVHKRRSQEALTYDEWRKVQKFARDKGIEFTASVFDKTGVDFLVEIKVPFIKLASSDLNNVELIEYIASKDVPLIISTGMSSLEEIKKSVNVYIDNGRKELIHVLHCVSIYPCKLEETSLNRIVELQSILHCPIGFSDHTLNSKSACVATSMGVSFIEKHFTIDKNLDGFDHKYASSPSELKEYIEDIRAIEKSIMNKIYSQSAREEVTKVRARRGLYLNKPLKKGDIITVEDLIALRPSNKFSPLDKEIMVGLELGEDVKEFQSMTITDNKVYADSDPTWKNANSYWIDEMKNKRML